MKAVKLSRILVLFKSTELVSFTKRFNSTESQAFKEIRVKSGNGSFKNRNRFQHLQIRHPQEKEPAMYFGRVRIKPKISVVIWLVYINV